MKKQSRVFVILVLLFSIFVTGCTSLKNSKVSAAKKPVIGMVMAEFDDTWRTDVRNELYKLAEGKIEIDIWSGDDSQEVENKKIDLLINRKVDVLIVNLVDKSAAPVIIDKAKNADIPIIFFNVEPKPEDMNKWDKTYYVGAKAEQSGVMQGQILVEYFKNNPAEDGIIHYVMLKGPVDHQDAIMRTQYSVKMMEEAGLKVKLLGEDTAMWDREKGQGKMQGFLEAYGENIDCVIANNDDMALGAIDALKAKGYFHDGKYMPVVGVDSTSKAVNAIKEGVLLGTVLNDAVKQAEAMFELSSLLAGGQAPNKENFKYPVTGNKSVWIEYRQVNKASVANKK